MRLALALALMLPAMPAAQGQNILMKDGSTVVTKGIVRRMGDTIIARMERPMSPTPAGQVAAPAPVDEVGFAVQKIARIDFPEPPQFREATALIAQGKLEDALARLDPVFHYYEGFRDAPGSWWDEAAVLKAVTLLTLENDREAASLIDQMSRFATEPKAVLAARVLSAAAMSRAGDHARALEIFEDVTTGAATPEVLAVAAIYQGRSHLALKQYEPAVLAFLQIPVLYPEERHLLPASALGAGQAYAGLEDRKRAKEAFAGLAKDFPASREAATAQRELAALARMEKALEQPK